MHQRGGTTPLCGYARSVQPPGRQQPARAVQALRGRRLGIPTHHAQLSHCCDSAGERTPRRQRDAGRPCAAALAWVARRFRAWRVYRKRCDEANTDGAPLPTTNSLPREPVIAQRPSRAAHYAWMHALPLPADGPGHQLRLRYAATMVALDGLPRRCAAAPAAGGRPALRHHR